MKLINFVFLFARSWLLNIVLSMKTFTKFFWVSTLCILVSGIFQTAYAGDLEQLLAKSQFERMITERLNQALKTTLAKDSYEVNVEVTLQEKPEPPKPTAESAPKKDPLSKELIPGDLMLGVIDAEPLIRTYAQKIAELESNKPKDPTVSNLDKYEIQKVNVSLGLIGDYPKDYQAKMTKWLKTWSNGNYGDKATATVSVIQTPPPKKPETEKNKETSSEKDKKEDKPKEETLLDQLSKVQHLLGFGLLALVALIAAAIFSFVSTANNRRHMEALAQQSKSAAAPPPPPSAIEDKEEEKPAISDDSVMVMRDLKELKEVTHKVVALNSEIGKVLPALVQIWLDSGREGFFKVAGLLDARMESTGKNNFEAENNFPKIPDAKRESVLEVFREMSQLKIKDKLSLFQSIYWDMMASKVLGNDSMIRPFSYLGTLPAIDVKKIVDTQSPDVQALLVLNMPEDSRSEYVKTLDIDKKKRIVKQSLNMDEVEVKDLEVLSETVKATVANTQATGRKLSMLPMSTQLLESLSALEELRVLREVTSGLRDQGRRLKKTYPTIAFIDEWNEDSLKKFLERLQPDQVVIMIRQIPQAKDYIVKNLMPRTAEIVNDDLKLADNSKESDIETKLGIVRGILKSLVQGGFIDMEQAYATTETGNNAKAA